MNIENTTVKQLQQQVKNFSYYVEEKKGKEHYVQHLCRLKEEVTAETLEEFYQKIESNPDLSQGIVKIFQDMLSSDVLSFENLMHAINTGTYDLEPISSTVTEFLDMFEFGNIRIKSVNHFGLDAKEAMQGRFGFGNLHKDRRLLKERRSTRYNMAILELTKYDLSKNYKKDIKQPKTDLALQTNPKEKTYKKGN